MTEEEVLEDMRRAVEAEKTAGEPNGWHTGNGKGLSLTLPLDVIANTIGTARLVLRAVKASPENDCSASLVITLQGQDFRAWRMDWKPVHSHTNMCGPKSLKGVTSETGIHDFACNAKLGLRRMQSEDLPICIPVTDVPHDFDSFVRYVCVKLSIICTEKVLSPPWSPTLF